MTTSRHNDRLAAVVRGGTSGRAEELASARSFRLCPLCERPIRPEEPRIEDADQVLHASCVEAEALPPVEA